MLIKDLKEIIKNMDDNLEVFVQTDPEGNGYFHFQGIDDDAYIPKNDLTEYVLESIYTKADLSDMYYEDEIDFNDFIKVAIIYP